MDAFAGVIISRRGLITIRNFSFMYNLFERIALITRWKPPVRVRKFRLWDSEKLTCSLKLRSWQSGGTFVRSSLIMPLNYFFNIHWIEQTQINDSGQLQKSLPFWKALQILKQRSSAGGQKGLIAKEKMFLVSTFLAIIYFYIRKKLTLVAFANGLSSPTFWEQFAFEWVCT